MVEESDILIRSKIQGQLKDKNHQKKKNIVGIMGQDMGGIIIRIIPLIEQ